MAEISEWYDFAEQLRATAMRMFDHLETPIEPETKIYALALLGRTISNFTGTMILLEANQVLEARILVRCCWENVFYIAGIAKKGNKLIEAMKYDDAASRLARGKWLLQNKLIDGQDKEFRAFLKSLGKSNRSLDVKSVSGMGVIDRGYIFYAQISADAGHPTVTSLNRHLVETLKWGNALSILPRTDSDEPIETISYACNALLGACFAAGEVLGGSMEAPEVKRLGDELLRLQGIEQPKEIPPQ
jgi:hypothetical protein